ncbi:tRNA dihydrouridine synthase DusB [Thorsellia kenyensis]|uniref:tRNA-dihydrouridine synthase B n=1 Tax=Thorsellia kenyensis TaxID=1549888 RepID=A0ABV6C6R2_9GAMM
MQIGHITLKNQLISAPMAGVSDKPFRELCIQFGAALAVSEMLSSNPEVWRTPKSKHRLIHDDFGIRSVQIAGACPNEMAIAAQVNRSLGAEIIDINMGCPAKKVNKKLAGSALLQYPRLVENILSSVVKAVDIPVTLKIRTGWDPLNKNCVEIAKIAENAGIQAIAVHGRTKTCLFNGNAEYDSIKRVKEAVSIPVIANGDINSAQKAKEVLAFTGADAIMIGRAAQGKPWLFQEILHYLETGEQLAPKTLSDIKPIVFSHIKKIHQFYGEEKGFRIARKHVAWYLADYSPDDLFRRSFNTLDSAQAQLEALEVFFENH